MMRPIDVVVVVTYVVLIVSIAGMLIDIYGR